MPHAKYIGYLTRGVKELVQDQPELLNKLLREFAKEVRHCEDWFYALKVEYNGRKYKFFVADNGEDGYTAMLPSEY